MATSSDILSYPYDYILNIVSFTKPCFDLKYIVLLYFSIITNIMYCNWVLSK